MTPDDFAEALATLLAQMGIDSLPVPHSIAVDDDDRLNVEVGPDDYAAWVLALDQGRTDHREPIRMHKMQLVEARGPFEGTDTVVCIVTSERVLR